MAISDRQKKTLRRLGHGLSPVVLVGDAGVSAAVIRECGLALAHHELIKVRIHSGDRESRDQAIDALASATGAEIIQRIGNVALLYRKNPDQPRIEL